MTKAKKVNVQKMPARKPAVKKGAGKKATVHKLVARKVKADPTTVATVWHSMQTICREMRHVIDRTAQNFLISQLHDISVGLWDAKGTTIAVAVGLPPQFLGAGFAVKALLEKFGDDISPGDIFLTHDPYHGGHCCHLPDWAFFRPIFYKGG